MYLSQDPIRLAEGSKPYGHVPDSNGEEYKFGILNQIVLDKINLFARLCVNEVETGILRHGL